MNDANKTSSKVVRPSLAPAWSMSWGDAAAAPDRLLIGARHDRPSQIALDAYWRFRIRRQLAGLARPGELAIEDGLLIGFARGRLGRSTWRPDDEGAKLLLTIPVVEPRPTVWNADPWASLIAIDVIGVELAGAPLRARACGRLTGAVDVLGSWMADDRGVRLYRDPYRWLLAVMSGEAGRSHACILDERGEDAAELLLERLIGCDDKWHAAEVEAQQRRARARAIARLIGPAPAAPFVLKGERHAGAAARHDGGARP